jgi:hypothetical protein
MAPSRGTKMDRPRLRAERRALPPRPRGAHIHCVALAAALLCTAVAAACGGATRTSSTALRAGLERYVAQVEPIRRAVNRLLEGADPILGAYHDHRVTHVQAARQIDALERRFASFTVDVAAIRPRTPALAAFHEGYADTYVLEDAYLSALDSGLAGGSTRGLPNTESVQRAAIIRWRTGLSVLAREAGLTLPADLQQAGRGEIAPSPEGG